MMLADSYPSWQSTLSVLAMAGVALGIYYQRAQTKSFEKQTKLMEKQAANPTDTNISPQPLRVTIDEEMHKVFASKADFEKHLADFQRKHSEVWQTLRGENQRISNEVTATRESIAGLEATTGLQNQQLAAIQSDIKQLLSRRS